MRSTATWFIPFALALTILTLPLAARAPGIMAPIVLVAAGFAAYVVRVGRFTGWMQAFLWTQVGLLGALAFGLLWASLS